MLFASEEGRCVVGSDLLNPGSVGGDPAGGRQWRTPAKMEQEPEQHLK